MRILLLHGFTGHRDVYFFPFLRRELEPFGRVICPSLPNPDSPSLDEWTGTVEETGATEVDLTVCHSLGGTLAMSMISRERLRTRALVTIGSSHGPKTDEAMNGFLNPPLSIAKLRQLERFYAIASYDDPWTCPEYTTLLVKQCGAVGLFFSDYGHFECPELPGEVMLLLGSICA